MNVSINYFNDDASILYKLKNKNRYMEESFN